MSYRRTKILTLAYFAILAPAWVLACSLLADPTSAAGKVAYLSLPWAILIGSVCVYWGVESVIHLNRLERAHTRHPDCACSPGPHKDPCPIAGCNCLPPGGGPTGGHASTCPRSDTNCTCPPGTGVHLVGCPRYDVVAATFTSPRGATGVLSRPPRERCHGTHAKERVIHEGNLTKVICEICGELLVWSGTIERKDPLKCNCTDPSHVTAGPLIHAITCPLRVYPEEEVKSVQRIFNVTGEGSLGSVGPGITGAVGNADIPPDPVGANGPSVPQDTKDVAFYVLWTCTDCRRTYQSRNRPGKCPCGHDTYIMSAEGIHTIPAEPIRNAPLTATELREFMEAAVELKGLKDRNEES